MPDPIILIVGSVVLIVVALVLVLLLVRRARRKAAAKTAQGKSGQKPVTLSEEDQQLLASLTAAKPEARPQAAAPIKPAMSIPMPADERKGDRVEAAPRGLSTSRSTGGSPAKKIRILIVDDNKDTRDNVSRLIAFEPDMEVVGQSFNGRQAIEEAISLRPHIVLMDINMPDMDGISATREMVVSAPYSQIIIMSVQFETDYMRAAMLAGARDYQTKPFSADELINCIRRVYDIGVPIYQKIEAAERAQATKSEVAVITPTMSDGNATPAFMVFSPKGGTGKTAIAVNVAAALRRTLDSVSLLDADLQFGDLPIDLNIRPTASITDLIASSRPDPDLLPKVLQTHSSGVNVLFGPQKPELMELITGNMMIQVVRTMKQQTRALVIDTSSYLTDHNLALTETATEVMLVINPDLPSVKDARMFLELAPDLGLKPEQIVLVVNRSTMLGAVPALQIEKALKATRTYAIPDDPKLRLSLIKGVTIFQLDANSPAALAIDQMAKAEWDRHLAPPVVAEPAKPATSAKAAPAKAAAPK